MRAYRDLHEECDINVVDFGDEINAFTATNGDLEKKLAQPKAAGTECRWINVNGLSIDVVAVLGRHYNLHPLALEDVFHTNTRTKADWYHNHAFAVLTMQKLVNMHRNTKGKPCSCPHGISKDNGTAACLGPDAGGEDPARFKTSKDSILPRYEEDADAKDIFSSFDCEYRKPVRTLHRYVSSANEEHTVFMEKNSALSSQQQTVSVEQVSIFLMADNTVITFFENCGADVLRPIYERLYIPETILRQSGDASMVMQAVIDAIVDLSMPVMEAYNNARKEMQIDVLTSPDISTVKSLYVFTEEIDMLQNLMRPIVHLVTALRDHNAESLTRARIHASEEPNAHDLHEREKSNHAYLQTVRQSSHSQASEGVSTTVVMSTMAHTYLGDVLDHCITMIQSFEQMDASATNLSSLIFNTVGAQTNNFMMILALVTVFFSPLTFISGYFGMNFTEFNSIHTHSDAFFWWVAAPSVSVFMIAVSGQTVWRAVRNRFVRIEIATMRRLRLMRTGT